MRHTWGNEKSETALCRRGGNFFCGQYGKSRERKFSPTLGKGLFALAHLRRRGWRAIGASEVEGEGFALKFPTG